MCPLLFVLTLFWAANDLPKNDLIFLANTNSAADIPTGELGFGIIWYTHKNFCSASSFFLKDLLNIPIISLFVWPWVIRRSSNMLKRESFTKSFKFLSRELSTVIQEYGTRNAKSCKHLMQKVTAIVEIFFFFCLFALTNFRILTIIIVYYKIGFIYWNCEIYVQSWTRSLWEMLQFWGIWFLPPDYTFCRLLQIFQCFDQCWSSIHRSSWDFKPWNSRMTTMQFI